MLEKEICIVVKMKKYLIKIDKLFDYFYSEMSRKTWFSDLPKLNNENYNFGVNVYKKKKFKRIR